MVTAGTLCCFVRNAEGRKYILSADHSLEGEPGALVLQPARFDGGRVDANAVAKLTRIRRGAPDVANTAAGAIAELLPGIGFDPTVPEIGPITGVASEVKPGDRVRAVGRTSGLVEGVVRQIGTSLNIGVGGGEVRRFEGLISTSSISAGGDSGAPVLNERGELIGMVYAGSQVETQVMPIQPVLDALGVTLILD